MKHVILLIVLLAFLAGCVSSGITPSKETVAKFQCARIVPMEPPPLGVPPVFSSLLLGGGGSIQAAQGFAVYNTIAILLEASSAAKKAGDRSQQLQAKLDGEDRWIPTTVVAKEVHTQLAAAGIVASVSPEVKPMPGVENRGHTLLMENWLGPIRAWYNSDEPVADYADIPTDGCRPYVIEAGILNYEIMTDRLLLQVVMRIVDPADGRVIGRARAANPWNRPKLTPFEQVFADDGRLYKEVFSAAARDLVNECLRELRLVQ